ncbi:glycosyltransferase family 4 protein [Leptothoe sp. LEGE 181152]|nr:glycosyltransferase family 4 protein [Leptothoe sp. LEGE 181152]
MHLTIIFNHIGNYHLARLRAASHVCQTNGWQLTAIQATDQTKEHPWGDLLNVEGFSLQTLLPASKAPHNVHPDSPEAVAALMPCLDSIKPDVLVIPGWGFPVSRAALSWCRRHQVPTILMSESKWDDEKRTWWKERLKSWLYVRKYDAALVGGPAHKDYLVQLGVSCDRIFFGYDVVDNDYFIQQAAIARQNLETTRQQQPQIPNKPYFLAVTRLIPRKNMVRLIEAFAVYCDKVGIDQAWPLIICGSGEEKPLIQQLIAEQKLEHVIHLPGFLTYQQIGSWYGLAGAFVHPALIEQWGLVVNEACAAGLPILCSNTVGACHSLVKDGENGFTFDPHQTSDITQTLLNMHSMDEGDRIKMGQASQRIISQHSPERFGEGLLNAVNTALAVRTRS